MNTRKYKHLEAFKNTGLRRQLQIYSKIVYLSHEKTPHNLFKDNLFAV